MNLDLLSTDSSGKLWLYLAISIPLIFVTGWLMLALQRHLRAPGGRFLHHLLWPFRDIRAALQEFFGPVGEPLKRIRRRSKEKPVDEETGILRRRGGWSRVQRQLPIVISRDKLSPRSKNGALPMVEVAQAVVRPSEDTHGATS
jgi:hypothetical protein